ncbi:hypothetical protein PR202_ga10451 [Eleusine coracana subsp. coracana]|uniref:Uncharacterized protein n=1 Tax=Eleusine coracana subsp. coracana TaxID=191504 RepID=A0AAV5C6S0_ELECO|nr:hypothetical protein PR202_ga10451 [Eleusine coracana subsp. coracana]
MPATQRSAERVARILDDYNRGSGQPVNKQKSVIFFSTNCPEETRRMVYDVLQIETEALGEKYLGLLTAAGAEEDGTFDYVAGRIWGFVNGWGENTLSCAGREVLIKANAQAVPTYPMSCVKLLNKVCDKIRTYISNYWWGSAVDSHKTHWQKWSKLTLPKAQGRMGFHDLQLFNKAMLDKQGWRLMTRPKALYTWVIKGKYYPHGNFMSAKQKRNNCETWKAMMHGRDVLKRGMIRRVGPGNSIDIWEDNWIQGIGVLKPRVHLEEVTIRRVYDLFIPGTRVWNVPRVNESFILMDAEEVLKIKPVSSWDEDLWAWAYEKHGCYSVRSAYRVLKEDQ